MERQVDVLETTIPKGCILRFEDAEGSDIRVASGCLWITQQDDSADYVLNPSQTFRVSRNGTTLAHALQAVSLQIAYRAEAASPGFSFDRGYRAVGRSALAKWLRDLRNRIVRGTHADAPQRGGLA
ncbi:DUF2917 domain-containing protein [Piscinibacter sp.]|uniref:DUF2917 domain-containing protein n=1 Tax=Piscinibacter sp. TaxID=1903157 RepID=UPI002F3E95C4